MSKLREAAQAVVDDAQVVSSADRIIVPQYVVSCDVLDALRSALAEPEWIPVETRPQATGLYLVVRVINASDRFVDKGDYSAYGWLGATISHWRELPDLPTE